MEYTETYMNEIEAVVNNEAAAKKLSAAVSVEELKKVFAEYGVEIEDAVAEASFQRAVELRNGGELSVDELDMVAGGKLSWKMAVGVLACAAIIGVAAYTWVGIAGGAIAAAAVSTASTKACIAMIGIAASAVFIAG